MNDGYKNLPWQLMMTASFGIGRFVPAASILPCFTKSVAFVSVVLASLTMVALVKA